jgi:hypothetical protein
LAHVFASRLARIVGEKRNKKLAGMEPAATSEWTCFHDLAHFGTGS